MQEKYEDGGHEAAAARVALRIAEVEQQEAEEPDPPRRCDQCGSIPCHCDEAYDKYQDRLMFPDEYAPPSPES